MSAGPYVALHSQHVAPHPEPAPAPGHEQRERRAHVSAPQPTGRPPVDAWPARAGFVVVALAIVPLTGWGAGWPALAAVAAGWPPISPYAALALMVAGLGLAAQHGASPRAVRRAGAVAAAATLLVVSLVTLVRQGVRLPTLALSDAVDGWSRSPELLFRALPSEPSAIALLFLALAFGGVAWGGRVGLRVAWAGAAGAGLVALLAAGVSPLPQAAPATPFDAPPPDRLIPPPLALGVLLVATGVLMRRGDDGGWWLPSRGAPATVARALVPVVILLPPAATWIADLLERRRVLAPDESMVLLPALLVLVLGAVVALATHQLRRAEGRDRDRDERRLRRQALREAEQVASRAEATLRVASDHYRTHLRAILDVAPAPFLAVDRAGHVSYANTAAATLLARPLEDVLGYSLERAWPALGADLHAALATSPGGAPIERTLSDPRSGRRYELRGFPGEEGAAVFLREI